MTGHAGSTQLHVLTQVNATAHVGGGNPTDVRKGSTLCIGVHGSALLNMQLKQTTGLGQLSLTERMLMNSGPRRKVTREQQGLLFMFTFRGSLATSTNTEQALHLWLTHQSALGQLQRDSYAWGTLATPHGSRLPVQLTWICLEMILRVYIKKNLF